MSTLLIVIIALFVIGAGIGIYALRAPGARKADEPDAPSRQAPVTTPEPQPPGWTHEVGSEFSGLSESARCDMIFAVGALGDERSHRLLLHALDDPSATVALAAAHTLARNGRLDDLRQYAQHSSTPRSQELLQLVSLLT